MAISRRVLVLGGSLGVAGLLAACGGAASPTVTPAKAPAPTAPATSAAASTSPTAVAKAEAKAGGALTVYSGRSKTLVEPLLAQFSKATGIDVKSRFGDSAELAAALLEEGKNSPADVFFSQDAGALGAVAARGLLTPLPDTLLGRVESRLRGAKGEWVGVSGRARVLVYNAKAVKEADLPDAVTGLTDAKWKGRVAWAPTNSSFQAFVTAMRLVDGEASAKSWLTAMKANDTKAFKNNDSIVEGVNRGEIDTGLVNHYYLLELSKGKPETWAARNYHFRAGGTGNIINVAGVGILGTAKNPEAARVFVDYLLGPNAQKYFSETTYEYPLASGVPASALLTPLPQIKAPAIDLSSLADLQATLGLLRDVGIV